MLKNILLIPLFFLLVQCSTNQTTTSGKQLKGKIISLVKMTKTFRLKTKKKTYLVNYSDKTNFENCKGPAGLKPPTKVSITVDENMVAKSIRVLLVDLPKEMIITTDEIVDLMDSKKKFFIGDARPKKKYNIGHIRGSFFTPPSLLKKDFSVLPKDKNTLLIFYCGGTSCPLSPNAAKIASTHGWKNVKVYVAGYPAWKDEMYPVYVKSNVVSKKLNKNSVIVDTREKVGRHIKRAVHFSTSKLEAMHEKYSANKTPKKKRFLPKLKFKKAPIFLYANDPGSDEVIEAYEYLSYWGYKKIAIVDTSFKKWVKKGLPTCTKKIGNNIVYVKKLVIGAVKIAEFVDAAKNGSAYIIDVRTDKEVQSGVIKGSIHIPYTQLSDNLNKIPKDKKVILHCAGGARASMGYDLLKEKGFKNISFLDGSFINIVQEHKLEI